MEKTLRHRSAEALLAGKGEAQCKTSERKGKDTLFDGMMRRKRLSVSGVGWSKP